MATNSLFSMLFRNYAVFYVKKSQVDTENGKNPEIFQFSEVLCIFFQIFDRLCGLKRQKGSAIKEFVVQ